MKKRTVLYSLVIISVLVMVGAVVWLQNKPDPQDKPTRGINQVDYSGPTSAEKDAGNDQKQAVIQRDTVDSGSTPF
jgi:hypothetical protein